MVFRILEYCVLIWRATLQGRKAPSHLPVILPMVVHLGSRRWNSPRSLRELHHVPRAAMGSIWNYLPDCGYLLVDLSPASNSPKDIQLPGEPVGTVVLEVMRAAAEKSLDRRMRQIFRQLKNLRLNEEQKFVLRQLGEYILRKSELDGETIRDRLRDEVEPSTEQTIMST